MSVGLEAAGEALAGVLAEVNQNIRMNPRASAFYLGDLHALRSAVVAARTEVARAQLLRACTYGERHGAPPHGHYFQAGDE